MKTKRVTRKQKEELAEIAGMPASRKPDRWGESYGFHNFHPTANQLEFIDKIHNNTITFCEAVSGSGKSATALYAFCKEYVKDNSKKLIIVRSPVEAGLDKIGALPNGYDDKVALHFESTRVILEQMLSKGKVETDLNHRIFFKIPNFCLGATFDNSLILYDEVQQMQPMILKLLLERIGIDSKVVICGDSTQLYADNSGKRNALKDAVPRFFGEGMRSKYPNIVYHSFGVQDIMRSDVVKDVVRAYTGLE